MNAPIINTVNPRIEVLRKALAGSLKALTRHTQFILYKLVQRADGRLDKIPTSNCAQLPANAQDQTNWMDAATACSMAQSLGNGWGVGFVLTPNDDLWCLDIDGAWNPDDDTWSLLSDDLCARFNGAAVEVSVSGHGLHIWGSGSVPAHSSKNALHHIELYTEKRFIALSGVDAFGDAATHHDDALSTLVAQYFPPNVMIGIPSTWSNTPCLGWAGLTDDDQLIEQALTQRKSRSAGEVFGNAKHASFRDLWEKNESVLSCIWPRDRNRPFDASSADYVLAKDLAYWTGKNCERIEHLMRRSALVRDKWDTRRGDHTYLQATILKACAEQSRFVGSHATEIKGVVINESTSQGFIVNTNGVFYINDDDKPVWICSTLRVTALARDKASDNWSRVLEWQDADGHPHQWVMPMEMLKADGVDMRGELIRQGLSIASGIKARHKLMEYITIAKAEARVRRVTRTGWHDGVFVLPDQTIGNSPERVLYQGENASRTYTQSGTLDDWRDNVARYCSGNSRLLLAVSSAFAGILLYLSDQESGGLHFVGDSSTGKTTALRAACSVFGGSDYLQRWRATSNGLESLAAQHNDSLLVLDEIAQVDSREVGEIAYMLANGSGKQRAGKTGAARPCQTWRLLFLSSGEIGLSQHMRDGGKNVRAGQEVRFVDIEADAGAGHGLFENLHGTNDGAQLSTLILEGANRAYGTAAIAFLNSVARYRDELSVWIKEQIRLFLTQHLPTGASGQAFRVCQRFALIGVAGECATEYGITGWSQGAALYAAAHCFKVWLENRGGAANQENGAILAQVKAFFESHEESRFTSLFSPESPLSAISESSSRATFNRAGFKRSLSQGGYEYFVLPEVFKREICFGYEPRTVTKVLIKAGWIKPASDRCATRSERGIKGKGTTRVYVFTSKIWEVE